MFTPPATTDATMIIRLCKTSLVATACLFFFLVAFGNLTDYGSNWSFVQHVLAMDTIFPDSTLKWRAITSPALVALAYWSIIAWQAAAAAILVVAVQRMAAGCRDPRRFAAAKITPVPGLTLGLLLYGLVFTVIGGEWFAMWQSHTWNGLDSAARFVLLDGVTLLIVIAPEG